MHAMQGGSLYHLYNGLWYDPARREPMAYRVRGGHPTFTVPTLAIDPRRSFKCMFPWTVPHTTRPFRQSGCTVKLLH